MYRAAAALPVGGSGRGARALKVGLAGLGAVGLDVARRLEAGIPGLVLAAVSVRDPDKARRNLPRGRRPHSDPARRGVGADLRRRRRVPAAGDVSHGRDCRWSSAARSSCRSPSASFWKTGIWWTRAKETGARILVPTGALLGLDAVRAAAEGTIHSVTMITRKPPDGLEGAPYLVERGISLKDLKAAAEGVRRHGARGRARLSRQCQRRGGAEPRRHRPGPHAARNLGRSGDHPQHPPHRGRCRHRAAFP